MIGRKLEALRAKTGVTSFAFSIADVTDLPNAEAKAIGYKVLSSRIKIDRITSPFDADVYVLMQQIAHVFPEYVRIQSMAITRTGDVSEATLQQISEGKPVNFVDATVLFDWLTMVPEVAEKPAAAPVPAGAPTGFRGQ